MAEQPPNLQAVFHILFIVLNSNLFMKKLSKTETRKEIGEFFKDIKTKTPKEIKKIKKLAMKQNIKLGDKRKKFCQKCFSTKLTILILDALRFDYVSYYGKMKNITPTIDKLAKDSLVYENAYTPSPDSGTTMPKFFTGNKNEKIVFGPKREGFVLKNLMSIGDRLPSNIRKKLYFIKKFIKNKGELKEGSLIKKRKYVFPLAHIILLVRKKILML